MVSVYCGDECIINRKPVRQGSFWNLQSEYDKVIFLPKGSIKKLIGRELSWSDEAVELI